MDGNQHDRKPRKELVRAAEVEPTGPPAAGDCERPRHTETDDGGHVLVPEHPEPTLTPGLRGDEAEEASDERLDRECVNDEDQAEEGGQEYIRGAHPDDSGNEERRADRP